MKIRVYLATTGGSVQVERLTRERAQQSAVCLQRTTKVLAISGNYDAFVRQPSGVIEREFGPLEPGAFRLDVSGSIDEGDSWQLGVFAAHMLVAAGRLAAPDDTIDAAVWLTGSVNNDLRVGMVAHLPEKLHASRDEFTRLVTQGVPITLVLPRGSRPVVENFDLLPELKLVEVDSTADLGAVLDLATGKGGPERNDEDAAEPRPVLTHPPETRRPGRRWLLGIALAAATGAAVFAILIVLPDLSAWSALTARGEFQHLENALASARERDELVQGLAARAYQRWLSANRPGDGEIEVLLYEQRPPDGRTCAAVHFRNVEPLRIPVPKRPSGEFSPSTHDGLCGLAYTLVVRDEPMYVALSLQVTSGRHLQTMPSPTALMGAESFSGRRSWAIELPWQLHEPFAYSIEVVAATYPMSDALVWWLENGETTQVAGRMADLGVLAISWRHEVAP